MKISGKEAQSYSISIKIISSDGKEIAELSTFKTSAGEFSTIWIVPNDIEAGMYTIQVQDAIQTVETIFELGPANLPQIPEPIIKAEPEPMKEVVPSWIKNNAKWWADGLISESDFVQGIQYLIREEILKVSTIQVNGEKSSVIPEWVKNNAAWWAEGLISENDFLNGIQYMIKVGIIIVKTMNLTSDSFSESGLIPSEYTCDGPDISPKLMISDVPKTTKSLALIMDDPDAPMGTFVHWVVWNISPDKSTIAKGENLVEPQGKTDFGKTGYGGPCPPSGTHRYFFKLFALDTMLELDPSSTKKDLVEAMKDHIVEQAILVGKYSRN